MIGRMIRAFGADDIANPRTTFRKLRFQMIADTRRVQREIAGSQRGFQFVTQLFFALPHRAAAFWRGANCSRSYWPEITSVQRIAPVRLTALVPARQSGVCTLNAGGWLCSLLERSCSWVARCA